MRYVTFPSDDNAFSCIVSTVHFCRLDIALHPADRVQHCSHFPLKNNEEMRKYCQFSLLIQITDQAFSVKKHFWAITMLIPRKL